MGGRWVDGTRSEPQPYAPAHRREGGSRFDAVGQHGEEAECLCPSRRVLHVTSFRRLRPFARGLRAMGLLGRGGWARQPDRIDAGCPKTKQSPSRLRQSRRARQPHEAMPTRRQAAHVQELVCPTWRRQGVEAGADAVDRRRGVISVGRSARAGRFRRVSRPLLARLAPRTQPRTRGIPLW